MRPDLAFLVGASRARNAPAQEYVIETYFAIHYVIAAHFTTNATHRFDRPGLYTARRSLTATYHDFARRSRAACCVKPASTGLRRGPGARRGFSVAVKHNVSSEA